ncbi:uncharacterized protein DUF1240 [Xenorhabdus ehlersii]|uniref:Integrase n=1 Tax=Xenorhabdus ehlersii TaxID=290111 RepID=A0A2D0INI4_9GAMM|nr:integrase [Xenorhabdus ehlersii]RKE93384.1 uncharacterized protein DUF1240 [Xenorhabdus ehlersii]
MPKITDKEIRTWIKSGKRFEGKADGNGLYLCYRKTFKHIWRFRWMATHFYQFSGIITCDKISWMSPTTYVKNLSLCK